ncbi:MAG: type IV pili methyl-accepting chemotaxis transducer N-terminal domain-containing protein [Betaproteobacteria bacterium]|nr:type IV pili methyl-accepting chemotaxis transducer N-terminal domain-containing protein [Betaproteobacteria bacterium]MDE2210497.1 type IV pili methyl-accepting chemotaxis transducer N-terminal domain-containing protein [Betaproteobacteria bacterium]
MRRPTTLATRFVVVGGALLALAVASIGLTLWVTWQLEGGAAAVNEAGRMRMQAWRLAAMQRGAAPAAAQPLLRRMDDTLALLDAGDPSRPLFVPWSDEVRFRFDVVQREWEALRAAWTTPAAAALVTPRTEAFVGAVDQLVLAIEHRLSHWTAILNVIQMAMMALAIASAVVSLYVGYLFVLDPVARLKAGLASIATGDLAARIPVTSRDEFGELTEGFNRMAQTLASLYHNLEDKVRDKTASLEIERQRLSALYEASALLSRAGSLDELARGFARKMRTIAHADAAAIRWSDETNSRYLLIAGDCLPETMAEDESCLLTGTCLCGQGQGRAVTRVIPIHPAAPAPLGNCATAGYETLVSVPITHQQRVLGEVDIFHRSARAVSGDERNLLETLASHLASGMESLRASALEREAAVAEERGLLARELHDSIAQSLAFLKIQVQLLRDAMKRQDTTAAEHTLGEIDAGLRESTGDVRELLVHFRTRTNAEDIEPALRTTLRKFEHQTGLATHFSTGGHGMPLDPDRQVQVLHVIQEALSNVRKHAAARQVWLDVRQAPQWRFIVRDDGHGFAARDAVDETHVGLRIMRERAARIGAQVEVKSAPGGGTSIVLTVPSSTTALPRRESEAA